MPDPLPHEVQRLLAGPIASMEHLELLLLLVRTEPRAWTAADAATELRLDAKQIAHTLRDLVDGGLASEDAAHYTYAPQRTATRADVLLLLETYNSRPVTLIRAVYDRRTTVARSFADAFRIRKEGP